jgi:TetR/AcrR family transcriptional repressor of nem operon
MARPLEHNREEVISAAMNVFWDKGYSATSMADLKIATGLNPGSLYASYQSKEDLFIETLEFYCDQSIENIELDLFQGSDFIKNIHALFKRLLGSNDDSGKGCFFVNTLIEMSPHNPRVKTLLEKYTEKYKSAFVAVLARAREKGQIANSIDTNTMAGQLMLAIWGLRVMQRSGLCVDKSNEVATIVERQLKSILSF